MTRAVYYCRVSTEEESQANALVNQIEESKDTITKKGWIEVDSYVDEGKSGTEIKKRDEYNRLFDDLDKDKFDIIVIKSQDRLMRNTKDWYIFIDRLVANNKKLFFYLDNKFYTPDDALITGIKAILAEDYSRELSKKINNAHRNRQAKGTNVVITSATWGYDKVDKEVVINEKEAEIVRLIYTLYIQGSGSRTISKELSNRGITSRSGGHFAETTIRKIIRNPMFKGTVIMNKRHRDFNTKKTIHNPESEWIYHKNAVPAIVSDEIWEEANKIMNKRSQRVRSDKFGERMMGKNLGKYDLSSKLVCGECNSTYWRRYRKNIKGEQIVDWSCSEYVRRGRKNIQDTRGKSKIKVETKDGGCDNRHIKEFDLNNTLLGVAKDVFNEEKSNVVEKAIYILQSVLSEDNSKLEMQQLNIEKNKITNQKNLLLDKLLDGVITDDDYKRKDEELEQRLLRCIDNEERLSEKVKNAINLEERIEDIKSFFKEKSDDAAKFDKLINHIDKIIVYREYIQIELDVFEPIKVILGDYKKDEKYLYVTSTKYMIPHTDKINSGYKKVMVSICT